MPPLLDVPSLSSDLHHDFLHLPVPVVLAGPPGTSYRGNKKTARFAGLKLHWARFIKRIGADTPSDSSAIAGGSLGSSHVRRQANTDVEGDEVDEIVIDRDWSEDLSSLGPSEDSQSGSSDTGHVQVGSSLGRDTTPTPDDNHLLSSLLWSLRWEVWPAIYKFFFARFLDNRTEARFQKEHWFTRKVFLSPLHLQKATPTTSSRSYCGPLSSLL